MESAMKELKQVKKKLVEVNDAIALYSREMTQTNEFFGGKGDRISKLTADLDQLQRNLPLEIAAGEKIKTENKALSVELDRARAELTPSEKLIRSYTAELEVAYILKKRLPPKAATDSLAKELESEADEVISVRGKDIYNLTQDTKHLKDKDIECTQENIAQTRMEKETGDSHLQMLVEWLQDENERRDRLLEIQAELEDYCEKTVSKSTIQSEKDKKRVRGLMFPFFCLSKLSTDREGLQPKISRKPATLSFRSSSYGRKQSRIPLSPANYASMHPCKENMLTPITKNKLQSPTIPSPFTFRTEERAARRKQARKLEDAQKVQLQTTLKDKAKTELRRLIQSFCFKARPLPSFYNETERPKSPLKKVTNAINKKHMATPSKKLEEKFIEKEAKKVQLQTTSKEKAETDTELRRLRQSFCFKARPLPSFYNERERPNNPLKKTPQANQKSLTPARKPPTTISQPSLVKKSSRRLWKTSDQNPADHPLSKYAALIDSEDTHYPIYIISQPSSVKKSSKGTDETKACEEIDSKLNITNKKKQILAKRKRILDIDKPLVKESLVSTHDENEGEKEEFDEVEDGSGWSRNVLLQYLFVKYLARRNALTRIEDIEHLIEASQSIPVRRVDSKSPASTSASCVTEGRYVVFGIVAMQLLSAAIYALTSKNTSSPYNVLATIPTIW
ncbi:WVD2-like protein 7 [Tanacetum coccineum]